MADEGRQCAICHDCISEDEENRFLPCAHNFHLDCLEAYARAKQTDVDNLPCPECRIIPSHAASDGGALPGAAPGGLGGVVMADNDDDAIGEVVDAVAALGVANMADNDDGAIGEARRRWCRRIRRRS